MSTRPEETEAHSLDGLGGLGREEREGGREEGREEGRKGGRTLPAFSAHPPIRNGGRSQAGVSALIGPFPARRCQQWEEEPA